MASIVISGDTSGAVTLTAPAVAGTPTLTLPTTSGTILTTAGGQTVPFAAGSAAAPSITFTGDTNTGIFSPTADTVGFTTGGSERMRIDSSGQVGVGVTPNTWSTGRVIEVGVSGTSLWGLSSGTSYVTAGYYFNSTDKFALTGNYAIFSQLVPSDGSFRWRASTATGTAGNDATMETNLTLTQGGTLVLKNGNTAATGIGITFPATQSASTNANTLDDYEEGTWTPTVNSGFTSPAYDTRAGTYTKVGNVVTFTLVVIMSSSTRAGSVIQFSLPFTSKNSTTAHNGGGASWAYLYEAIGNSTTTNVPMLYINNNAATMDCYSTTGSAFLGTDLSTANPYFYIGGSYLTA